MGPPHPKLDDCKADLTSTTSPPSSSPTSTTITSTKLTTYPSTTAPPKTTLKILAVAGKSNLDYLSEVELFNPFSQDNNCIQPQPYPQKVYGLTGSNNLFCGGVVDGSIYSKKCYELNEKTWTPASNLIRARVSASSIRLPNGSFWISGGYPDTSETTSEIMVKYNGGFAVSAALPTPMDGHCSAIINKTHVFMAGSVYNGKVAYIVNVATEPFGFSPLPPMFRDRYGAACGTILSTPKSNLSSTKYLLIVAGGYGDVHSVTTSEAFSTSTNSWIQWSNLPRGYKNGGYLTTEEHPLIMVGGLDEHGNAQADVMTYQHENKTFEMLPGKMSTAREQFVTTTRQTEEDC